ncbi:MAG: UDP-N-acetylmuramoyl-L-alanyl-D-glutamate--2,6-diaminopimelate ligase [Lachnospiraceae bacterium]|nr:UDP-N-acetylmuramoyl-L-alanyl-D-glutamate--2,6-diaminopimelate ligase [Lachnospiraceae bacterium]
MKTIIQLLKGLTYEVVAGREDLTIPEIVNDTRKVTEGCLFFCIIGANRDGHDLAGEAYEKGARCFIVSKDIILPDAAGEEGKGQATVIKVEDTRYAMAFISANFYDNPGDTLKVIGVTGTKGKTTTAFLVKDILEQAGYKVGLIGTIETIIGEKHIPAANTTPESLVLQQTFREMVDAGIQICVMEVSSQGLKLHRTQGFTFEIGLFTNIEPDHIGPNEHADFAEYMMCKGLLFKQCRKGIINGDDPRSQEVIQGHTCEIETYGLTPDSDLWADSIRLIRDGGRLGVAFRVEGKLSYDVETGTPGTFSVYNALAAIAICRHFEISPQVVQTALKEAKVKGRIEPVKVSDDFTLLIDYAHNAMSLESLLKTLRAYEPHRLVCLFGCGGNRSKLRRYEMGEISGKLADLTIITSDNPRDEDPMDIIADIKTGIGKTDGAYVEIPDRKEAIRYAIRNGQPGDIVVLAGKGHEDYQEIKGVKYPMDERVLIREILEENGQEG